MVVVLPLPLEEGLEELAPDEALLLPEEYPAMPLVTALVLLEDITLIPLLDRLVPPAGYPAMLVVETTDADKEDDLDEILALPLEYPAMLPLVDPTEEAGVDDTLP